ncbi:hypothetical protein [Streptomyces sp. G45]|uniref:hypothetical protein n=1 Tax=Streptomyces sp. G45 TaxID=3406627 RepID=UPI003C1F3371
MRARLIAEWSDEPPLDRIELTGDGRVLTLDPLDSGRLRVQGPDGSRTLTLPPATNPHEPLIADFARAAALGRPPACPVADARAVDEIIAAVTRQSRTDSGGPAHAPSSADQGRSQRGSGVSD